MIDLFNMRVIIKRNQNYMFEEKATKLTRKVSFIKR